MTLFILASRRPVDEWEQFVGPSAQLVHPFLSGRSIVDYRSIQGDHGAVFRVALSSGPPESVFLALCHGDDNGTLHVDGQGFIGVRDADLFRDKFCYFVACSAGRHLGPAAIKSGAVGFIGFLRPIVAIPSARQDEQRKVYLSGLVAYLQGETIPRAAEIMKTELRRAVKGVARGQGSQADIFVMGMLTQCILQLTWGEPRVPRAPAQATKIETGGVESGVTSPGSAGARGQRAPRRQGPAKA